MDPVLDRFSRPLGSLRLSLTDRCNMRCRYCMPEDDYAWLPRSSLLTFEEMERLVQLFAGLGVTKVRLTGGEPLLRHDVAALVRRISVVPGIHDLAMTTNGLLLRRYAESLKAAGLGRLTISLDTLRPERALEFARTERHADTLDGIRAARDAGFTGTKLNTVVIRGYNDDEIGALLDFARAEGVEVRFIEYMDVGGATRWSMAQVVTRDEILDRVARTHGAVETLSSGGTAPADGSGCRTARRSGSSRRLRPPSAGIVTAAASRPMAPGSSASTPGRASTCGTRSAGESRTASSAR